MLRHVVLKNNGDSSFRWEFFYFGTFGTGDKQRACMSLEHFSENRLVNKKRTVVQSFTRFDVLGMLPRDVPMDDDVIQQVRTAMATKLKIEPDKILVGP